MPLQPTPQHVYATNLAQPLGYPLRNPHLRNPDPGKELEEPYKSQGLQIGDIGYVDDYGAFNLLFNVMFPPNDDLGQPFELNLPPRFDEPLANQVIQPGAVFLTGVDQILDDARMVGGPNESYRFVARAGKGSILILPNGATLFELEDRHLEEIRNYVTKYALAWCRHAQKDTLCLITAVYKARTWTLGSFDRGVVGGLIHVEICTSDPPDIPLFTWQSEFQVDNQQVHRGNMYLNQAVFIKGFRIRARNSIFFRSPQEQLSARANVLRKLRLGLKDILVPRATIKIKYFPALDSGRSAVHPINMYPVPTAIGPQSQVSTSRWSNEHPDTLRRLVITHIRLENFDLDHIDSGICMFVHFGTTSRRTNNKPYASIIEWNDEIPLPSNEPVRIAVGSTFQLGSTLGTREISVKKTINTNDMPNEKYTLKFSVGNTESRPSLSITLVRHSSYHHAETRVSPKNRSSFASITTQGFENFYSFHREHETGYLNFALDCFKSALHECGYDPGRLATTRFNIATTEFLRCQTRGIYAEIGRAIKLYRGALESWGEGHPDRPATLLLLAQALLSRYGRELSIREIEQLLEEIPPGESRNRQTADAILATCGFYHAIDVEYPADVDYLLANFERGVYTPPYGYFDRPRLLYKLGFAFWRRFRSSGTKHDLEKAIMLNAEALQVPDGHDDQKDIATCLGNSLFCALQSRGELIASVGTLVRLRELGKKVIAILDDTGGVLTSSESLQERGNLGFSVAEFRELMQSEERRQQAAADNVRESAGYWIKAI